MTAVRSGTTPGTLIPSLLFYSALILSISLKLFFSQKGHNFDLDSYHIVADLVTNGKNVYTCTERYNYGPVWFYILAVLKWVQEHVVTIRSAESFHFYVAFLLSWVDAALAWIAWKKYRNLAAAVIFLLNPISLLITGYHSQFDNFAILIAILSVFIYTSRLRYAEYWGLILLGGSLALKHVFIFFPLWLFFSETVVRRGPRVRWLALCAPVLIFLLSFIPYSFMAGAADAILKHVFQYNANHNIGFFPHLLGFVAPVQELDRWLAGIPFFSGTKFLWFCAMVASGYVFRKRPLEELVLLYTIALCVFSTAIADQYLVIPALAACLLVPRSLLLWYFGVATIFLILPPSNSCFCHSLAQLFPKGLVCRWNAILPLFLFLTLQLWEDWKRREVRT